MDFLSIDLDYWFCVHYKSTDTPLSNAGYSFIQKAINSIKRTIITKDHDEFLNYLPNSIDHLTNIDYHSDIINPSDGDGLSEPEEGNWINFIKFRSFEWRYPDYDSCIRQRKGICGYFDVEKDGNSYYNDIKCIEGTKDIDFSRFDMLGISVSPCWLKGLYGYSVQDQRLVDIFKLIGYKI